MNKNERYEELLRKDDTHNEDVERKALFYIIAGNDDLYKKVDSIYNFEENCITPENCIEGGVVDFCSSSMKLIQVSYNLFNGYPADLLGSLYLLDTNNFELVMEAIKIRLNK